MELVVERPHSGYRLALHQEFAEPAVLGDGAQHLAVQVVVQVHRVGRDHHVDHHAAEPEEVLDGVHGQPRPRSDASVAVMHLVRQLVQRTPVQEPMNQVEVKRRPVGNHEEQEREPERVLAPLEPRHQPVRIGPHGEHQVAGADRDPARAGPEDVVPHLIAQEELRVVALERPRIEPALPALAPEGVEEKVQTAREQHHHPQVDAEDLQDPAGLEDRPPRRIRHQVEPDGERESHVDRSRGQQEARAEDIARRSERPRRPGVERRVLERQLRVPAPG